MEQPPHLSLGYEVLLPGRDSSQSLALLSHCPSTKHFSAPFLTVKLLYLILSASYRCFFIIIIIYFVVVLIFFFFEELVFKGLKIVCSNWEQSKSRKEEKIAVIQTAQWLFWGKS